MRTALAALSLVAFTLPAAAAHCGHGRIYRVSMGVCVGAHSRLAREVETVRRQIERPPREQYFIDVLIPAERPPEPPPTAPDWGAVIPYTLPGSMMFDGRAKAFISQGVKP